MRATRDDRGRSRLQLLAPSLGALALLAFLVGGGVAAAGLVSARSQALTEAGPAVAAGPGEATVLHLRGTRNDTAARANGPITLEAWLDEATNEGKIVETAPDGTVRRVASFSGDTYVLYLGDAQHAVIRRGFGPDSPFATGIRDEVRRYQSSVEPGAYTTVERVSRAGLPADVFRVELPPGSMREEYTEGQPGNAGGGAASLAGLPYAVYAAPTSFGTPVAAFRRASTAPAGGPRSDSYYLIYRTAVGEVQVLSGLPPDAPAGDVKPGQGKKDLMVGNRPEIVQVAGVSWEVASSPRGVQGRANLGDAYVTIYAPDQAVFERVAASLVRLERP